MSQEKPNWRQNAIKDILVSRDHHKRLPPPHQKHKGNAVHDELERHIGADIIIIIKIEHLTTKETPDCFNLFCSVLFFLYQ